MKKLLLVLGAAVITSAAMAIPCPTNYIFAQQAGWRLSGNFACVIGTNYTGTISVKIKRCPTTRCGFQKVVCTYQGCNGVATATAFAPNIIPMPGSEGNWVSSSGDRKLFCGPTPYKDNCRFLINPTPRMVGFGFNGYGY